MSTFLKPSPQLHPIQSIADLKNYFKVHAKPKSQEWIGIECELFGIDAQTGEALPYFGRQGIEAILNRMAGEFGYERIQEARHTIALKKNGNLISLEPGGQVELSAAPVKNMHQVKKQLDQFFDELSVLRSEEH